MRKSAVAFQFYLRSWLREIRVLFLLAVWSIESPVVSQINPTE